jgi:hypothetical protein
MSNRPNCFNDPVIGTFARRARFMLACFASIAFAPALSSAQPDAPPRVVALSASDVAHVSGFIRRIYDGIAFERVG